MNPTLALQTALRAARLAGKAALKHFGDPRLKVQRKDDGSPVSAADKAADAVLRREIRRAFPRHGMLSEESGFDPGDGLHRWIADPVDGTRAFVRGIPSWTVLLTLEVEGGLWVAGAHALALPNSLWAERGRGAFENGRRLRVSRRAWKDSWVTHGPLTVFAEGGAAKGLLRLERRAAFLAGSVDAMGYASVARGEVEAFVEGPGPEVWDLAAPRLIVEEAGGRFTNLRGEATHLGPGAIASNRGLHTGILQAFRRPGKGGRA